MQNEKDENRKMFLKFNSLTLNPENSKTECLNHETDQWDKRKDERNKKNRNLILESKDFSFSLEKSEESQQFCFSKVLSPKESYACLCIIAKIRHEENMEQDLKKIIDALAKNAEQDSEQP